MAAFTDQGECLMSTDDPKALTANTLLQPEYASSIAEDLFRDMLPQTEAAFRQELHLWHPELGAGRYLGSRSYPRCWIVTAALIFATAFPEYARFLFESLRQSPDIFHRFDIRKAEAVRPEWASCLNKESWRRAICGVGSQLYFFGPPTLMRAFAVGLNLAFVQPPTARIIVDMVRATAQESHDRQVAAAEALIRRHPISGQAG